jgi:hypothetical protein
MAKYTGIEFDSMLSKVHIPGVDVRNSCLDHINI